MSQSSDVAKLLQDLGNTPAEVASTLRVKGIHGVRNTVRTLNPVVRYVLSLASDVWNLNIIEGNTLSMNFRDGRKRSVTLPEAVKQFLDAFNQGAYSDLELPT
jgi:hypothetical protein